MSQTANPFPIPKIYICPYCQGQGVFCSFNTDHNLAYYSHKIKVRKKVGQVTYVTLQTIHQFVTRWVDEKWQAVDVRFGSSKIIERVELGNGGSTDWESCDRD